MGRIVVFGAGSRGDIEPCIRLGRGLSESGFDVLLAAPENFGGLAKGSNLAFHPIRGDVQAIMASETGRRFMERGNLNPLASIRSMRALVGPVALDMAEDVLDACRDADLLISLAVFGTLAKSISELAHVRLVHIEPTPMLPTSAFPAPGWPVQRNLGGFLNRLSGQAMLWIIWQWYGPSVNHFRQRHGLRPLGGGDFHRILRSNTLLGAYSAKVVPRPVDWPDNVSITGYWHSADDATGWQPTRELVSFLEAGSPPVYVGFGSMAGRNPEQLAATAIQALDLSGQRGVLMTGWGGMKAETLPKNVIMLDSAPHSWLFPRMAAVVHHGGAGTTAEGLRAGIPSVIVPFTLDQPFWGRRVQSLGVGPGPIPAAKIDTWVLASMIERAVTDTDMRARAAALGEAIRSEDGIGQAVRRIQEEVG